MGAARIGDLRCTAALAAVALGCTAAPPGRSAEPERGAPPAREQPGFADLYGDEDLVPTPAEERARWAAATAGEVARSLMRLPGVADARVHLALPEAASVLDAAPRPAKASVLLRREPGAAAVDESAVRALVAGAVDGLSPSEVAVVQVAPGRAVSPPAAALVRIGPVAVTRDSAPALKAILGSALALDIVLAAALAALWRARRAARAD